MYTPEDSPFEKFRTEKLKGVAMSPDVLELMANAYECGFIDGMQKQMQSSVDRAVNRMAEQAEQAQPVATKLETQQFNCFHVSAEDFQKLKALPVGTKIYTAPPPRPVAEPHKPLTDEQKDARRWRYMRQKHADWFELSARAKDIDFDGGLDEAVDEAIAAHGIKGEA